MKVIIRQGLTTPLSSRDKNTFHFISILVFNPHIGSFKNTKCSNTPKFSEFVRKQGKEPSAEI